MLKSVGICTLALLFWGNSTVFAEDGVKPCPPKQVKPTKTVQKKPLEVVPKSTIKKPEGSPTAKPKIVGTKEEQPLKKIPAIKKAPEKSPAIVKQPVAVITKETEYYRTSPAQGHPADGQLKPGTKVRVVDKAGSYVRVLIEIEAYVPADSFEVGEKAKDKQVIPSKKPAPTSETKKPSASEKNLTSDNAALKKKLAAQSKQSESKLSEKALLKQKLAQQKKGRSKEDAVKKEQK